MFDAPPCQAFQLGTTTTRERSVRELNAINR